LDQITAAISANGTNSNDVTATPHHKKFY